MILSGKTIQRLGIITPCVERSQHEATGTSFGLSMGGYDVCLDQDITVLPGFTTLASTREVFKMPKDVIGVVHDKSSWARSGLFVQNTVIEPGWEGYLTLELTYSPVLSPEEAEAMYTAFSSHTRPLPQSREVIRLPEGAPIAQVVFHQLDQMTEGYGNGKYQNQERGPQHAR